MMGALGSDREEEEGAEEEEHSEDPPEDDILQVEGSPSRNGLDKQQQATKHRQHGLGNDRCVGPWLKAVNQHDLRLNKV